MRKYFFFLFTAFLLLASSSTANLARQGPSQPSKPTISLIGGISQDPKRISDKKSSVGIYLNALTRDEEGNIWAGGSVWLLQGLLLRYDGSRIKTSIPLSIETIQDVVFNNSLYGWLIGNYCEVYMTSDGGLSWQKRLIDNSTKFTCLIMKTDMAGWVAGSKGVVYHTADGGLSWEKQNSGTNYDLTKLVFVDSVHGWGLGGKIEEFGGDRKQRLIMTGDGGQTWNVIHQAPPLDDVTFVNQTEGWGIDRKSKQVFHTVDGGETWAAQFHATRNYLSSLFFLNSQDGWVVGDFVLRTRDGGRTWRYLSGQKSQVRLDQVIFKDGLIGYGISKISSEGKAMLYRTEDGGQTWRSLSDTWVKDVTDRVYLMKFGRK